MQALAPGETTFLVPIGATITTTSGSGVAGDNSQDWRLTNQGSIIGNLSGVAFFSTTPNGARFDNYGTVQGNNNVSGGAAAGVNMRSGGVLANHDTGQITSNSDGVYVAIAGAEVINDGLIQGAGGLTSVYFAAGGTLTQTATGRIRGGLGVIFNGGLVAGSNAGSIAVSRHGLWARAGANGSFTNTGTISTSGTSFDAVRAEGGAVIDLLSGGDDHGHGPDGQRAACAGRRLHDQRQERHPDGERGWPTTASMRRPAGPST